MKKGVKKFFDRVWFLLFKDDSFKGWALSIIVLFIFIKFIFFPGLSLVTGTALPLAIVESCSMYHEGDIFSDTDTWWDYQKNKYKEFDITKNNFSDFIFEKGFNKGDILFIMGVEPKDVKIGDVIIFAANRQNPIIHRVIDIKEKDGELYFSTIGDNNPRQITFEKEIHQDRLMGRAVIKIAPYFGWVKLILFEGQRDSNERGFCSMN